MKLSKRLQAIAQFVLPNSRVSDIGTDHGMLPCYLVQTGISTKVIAADMNALPLAGASKLIKEYQLDHMIETRLGNGLAVLEPDEVDIVTISGMGGPLMVDILQARPEVVSQLKRIILQPNVGAFRVRQWAQQANWHIVEEELVLEDGRYYEIIVLAPGVEQRLTEVTQWIGPMLLEKKHRLLPGFLEEMYRGDQLVLSKLAQSDSAEAQEKIQFLQKKWNNINEVIPCQFHVN